MTKLILLDSLLHETLFQNTSRMAAPSTLVTVHPGVLWAQRERLAFVTIEVSDCETPGTLLEKGRLHLMGAGGGGRGSEKKTHEVEMKLFKEIVPDKTKYGVRPMHIDLALERAEGLYWNRLPETKVTEDRLKVDFQKRSDEDDSDDDQDWRRRSGGDDANYGRFWGRSRWGYAHGFDMNKLSGYPGRRRQRRQRTARPGIE
jgi:hypothetical protein